MSEHNEFQSPENSNSNNSEEENKAFKELRNLLVGPEKTQIDNINKKLEFIKVNEEELSHALPQAVVLSTKKDNNLTKALTPAVEEVIDYSIKKNPKKLADAIFPIIGPAIRKAISNALSELTQSVNQSLEHSFNLKWRLEALRTGKPFSEIVLSNSLLYRVEQVFLIHEKTGIPLQHVVLGQLKTQDSDLVSGMLKAIQDFVEDSFGAQEGDELESFKVGDLSIWLEEGPGAIIAAVIRGNAPHEYRNILKEALENIHLEFGNELESFNGDASIFDESRPYLEACLISKSQQSEKESSSLPLILLFAILIPILVWSAFKIHKNIIWSDYINSIRSEPGMVITDYGRKSGKYFITGLKDPLAADPNKILSKSKLKPENVISKWEPYLSFNPDLIIKRVSKKFDIPKTVTINYNDGILYGSGNASKNWVENVSKGALNVPGVYEIDFNKINTLNPEEIKALINKIENANIYFDSGSYRIKPSQRRILRETINYFHNLTGLLTPDKNKLDLQIFGSTDNIGTYEENYNLSIRRAENIKNFIIENGINLNSIKIVGIDEADNLLHNSASDRRVYFKINMSN